MRWFGLIATAIILVSCSTEVEVKNVDCNQHNEIIKSKEAAFVEFGYDAQLIQDLIVLYATYANFCNISQKNMMTLSTVTKKSDICFCLGTLCKVSPSPTVIVYQTPIS